MDTAIEGRKRGSTKGEFILQWGNRKRPRGINIENKLDVDNVSGLLKKAIRVDRRVARAEKQACRARKLSGGDFLRSGAPDLHGFARESVKRFTDISSTTCANHTRQQSCEPVVEPCAAKTAAEKNLPLADTCDKSASGATRASETLTLGNHVIGGISTGDFQGESQSLESPMLPKFMLALSRTEKEEDFLAIKGAKLPQRPKRRAKHIQRALQCISPGAWLSDLSLDRYEVREKKSIRKKPRGLKAMGSMGTETD